MVRGIGDGAYWEGSHMFGERAISVACPTTFLSRNLFSSIEHLQAVNANIAVSFQNGEKMAHFHEVSSASL